jgi:hypothetical protein
MTVATAVCPVCGDSLPSPSARGRPREVCSRVCAERARQRRRRAAKQLDYADLQEELAEQERKRRPTEYIDAEMIERRVASFERRAEGLRELAADELRGLPA